ncbi:MAG: hypothetical protein ABJN75_06995 [Hoeflea sp.]|uniref:hypothetical protein n=1 Tax=Hoeflea sp. TaxID=1940281 RepID=UPI0032968CAA
MTEPHHRGGFSIPESPQKNPISLLLSETDLAVNSVTSLGKTIKYGISISGAICFAVAGLAGAVFNANPPIGYVFSISSQVTIISGFFCLLSGLILIFSLEKIEGETRSLRAHFEDGDRSEIDRLKIKISKLFSKPTVKFLPYIFGAAFSICLISSFITFREVVL